MKLIRRAIDPTAEDDRAYALERHCRINYACDSPWATENSYAAYRRNWFAMQDQVDEFWDALTASTKEPRAIAELIDDEASERVGYFWGQFWENREAGLACLELQDLYIEEAFRRQGVAEQLLAYAEEKARACGANLLRSGTGCANAASIALHQKQGYAAYRVEFEKRLDP